ncbi:hypothetical protein DE146DRAFT_111134 [Phaeosphaeria sp. MPI-PUGE-AT-0046c]|nr:hypothetical protein DE146DRAFT_111134 [Phaeosphaeria sp. MPI-PUGE-AT-0046c]
MRLTYSPTENKGWSTIQCLCHGNAYSISPTTFPDCHSSQDYADSHSKVMKLVSDLRINSYDVTLVKDEHVCLRYVAFAGSRITAFRHWTEGGLACCGFIFRSRVAKLRSGRKSWIS